MWFLTLQFVLRYFYVNTESIKHNLWLVPFPFSEALSQMQTVPGQRLDLSQLAAFCVRQNKGPILETLW